MTALTSITAGELIKRAYALAQIIDPNEEIEGFQAAEGLDTLNEIIHQWSSLSVYIPSYKIITITLESGKYKYEVDPPITQLSEANLLDQNNVQYVLQQIDLQYFNTLNFPLSVSSPCRPNLIFLNNALDLPTDEMHDPENFITYNTLFFYPVPDNTYTVTLYAMTRLMEFDYSDDIVTIPRFFLRPLRVELARELSTIYGTILPQRFEDKYEELMRELMAANRRDRSVQIRNPFIVVRRYRPWGTYVG